MALRKIALQGEECLTKVCRPVTDFNSRLRTLLDDMADTLEESGGVGLAAPQVGVLRRVCVVLDEDDQLIELINPEIIYTEGEQTGLEGCLSVPGKYGIVKRPNYAKVRAYDRDGNEFEVEGEELMARCFCHELDHLDGIVYTEVMERFLTDEELADLQASFPTVWGQYIEKLSEYMASTGKRYQSHAATIRRWAGEDAKKAAPPSRNRDYSVKEDETV